MWIFNILRRATLETRNSGLPYCDLTPNITYPCNYAYGTGDSACRSQFGLNFYDMQIIVDNIYHSCTADSRLHVANPNGPDPVPALTLSACRTIAGSGPTWYPASDIWTRLTTWKFPLLQLASLFPRPPLGHWLGFLVVVRLLGNPIGTIENLIVKFASCQGRALWWKRRFCTDLRFFDAEFNKAIESQEARDKKRAEQYEEFEWLWKTFTIIVDSCDEWGRQEGDHVRDKLAEILLVFKEFEKWEKDSIADPNHGDEGTRVKIKRLQKRTMNAFVQTKNALAADRGTKLLPVGAAILLFIFAIVFAFIRTTFSGPQSQTVFLNLEAYSIAYSALYFWILSIIVLGAAIGSSQTESTIPRILKRLERDINHILKAEALLGSVALTEAEDIKLFLSIPDEPYEDDTWKRILDGGAYSWQPGKWFHRVESSQKYGIAAIRTECLQLQAKFHIAPTLGSTFAVPKSLVRLERIISFFMTIISFVGRNIAFVGTVVPGSALFPLWVVNICLGSGLLISWLVPPTGFSCRSIGQVALVGVWISSWILDFLNPGKSLTYERTRSGVKVYIEADNKVFFYFHLIKEIFSTLATLTILVVIQVGFLDRCSCYTYSDSGALILPGSKPIADILYYRIQRVYPTIAFVSIFYQLFGVTGQVAWQYFEAWQVFVQRDDKKSNWERCQKARSKNWELWDTSESTIAVERSPNNLVLKWWHGWSFRERPHVNRGDSALEFEHLNPGYRQAGSSIIRRTFSSVIGLDPDFQRRPARLANPPPSPDLQGSQTAQQLGQGSSSRSGYGGRGEVEESSADPGAHLKRKARMPVLSTPSSMSEEPSPISPREQARRNDRLEYQQPAYTTGTSTASNFRRRQPTE